MEIFLKATKLCLTGESLTSTGPSLRGQKRSLRNVVSVQVVEKVKSPNHWHQSHVKLPHQLPLQTALFLISLGKRGVGDMPIGTQFLISHNHFVVFVHIVALR